MEKRLRNYWIILTVFLLITTRSGDKSFVATAPVGDGLSDIEEKSVTDINDANVRQLESLKHSLGKTLSIMKSQSSVYSDISGHREAHSDTTQQVEADGELLAKINRHTDIKPQSSNKNETPTIAKIRTEIEIPPKGLHKAYIEEEQIPETLSPYNNKNSAEKLQESDNPIPPIALSQRQIPSQQRYFPKNKQEYALQANIGQDIDSQDVSNNNEPLSPYNTGVQYSPLDMAEYVFWTGDEKGVTLAIEEFLRDGLMTRDDAIAFLQEIKFNLEYLQAHYSQQGVIHTSEPTTEKDHEAHRSFNNMKYNGNDNFGQMSNQQQYSESSPRFTTDTNNKTPFNEMKSPSAYDLPELQKNIEKKNNENASNKQTKTITVNKVNSNADSAISDEEYEILLERLRVADFLYTQYSLEEVIYQLAKVMFSQSLTRGSAEAQEALQKFTTFLETETELGHISRSLEKKVLDVLIAALTDTLTEHPELVAAAREGLGGGTAPHLPPGNNILQQILEMTPEEKEAAKSSLYAAFKVHHNSQRQNSTNQNQSEQNIDNHFGDQSLTAASTNSVNGLLGKYKTPLNK